MLLTAYYSKTSASLPPPLSQTESCKHTHSIIKFALSVGHGNSDERSLAGNKGANEWWGEGKSKGLL